MRFTIPVIFAYSSLCVAVICQQYVKLGKSMANVRPSSALDKRVLETVFFDLVQDGEGSPREHVAVAPEPPAYKQNVEDVLYQYHKELWEKLKPEELKAAREAAEHLVRRIKVKDVFRIFKPANDRIAFEDEAQPNGLRRDARIRVWPPGYSHDTKVAIVRVVVPWSIHHGEGTYVLAERNDKWTIILRQFVYYP